MQTFLVPQGTPIKLIYFKKENVILDAEGYPVPNIVKLAHSHTEYDMWFDETRFSGSIDGEDGMRVYKLFKESGADIWIDCGEGVDEFCISVPIKSVIEVFKEPLKQG